MLRKLVSTQLKKPLSSLNRNSHKLISSQTNLVRVIDEVSPSTLQLRFQTTLADATLKTDQINSPPTSASSPPVFSYRCSVDNPLKHDVQHLNKFYTIPFNELKKIDPLRECLNESQYAENRAFSETSLMIRKPAIEIINYLRQIDISLPAYRFILYGPEDGTGKKCTLLHLLHYCYKDNWLIINVPDCTSILRKAKESQASGYKEGRLDTPFYSAIFLKRFLVENTELLKKLNLKTTKTYKWNNRDSSAEGTPILDLIDYANQRVKYSSDICGAILREIKLQAAEKNFKVFIAVDQVNGYFGPTRLRRPDKSEIFTDDITIVRNIKKLLKNDWTNAVIVGTIGSIGVIMPSQNRHKKFYDNTIPIALRRRVECTLHYEGPLTPAHLLKKEGFYYMEPFVPIEVPAYSDEEILNHYEYYKEKNWIQSEAAKTDVGRDELIFMSGKNPTQFRRVCEMI